MRRPFICGNWKMFKTIPEAVAFIEEAKSLVAGAVDVDVGIGAPATALAAAVAAAKGTNIMVGGQNCYWEKEGAFTGEISVDMLKDIGCSFVIIGHSERRQYFGETNETVNKKVKAALAGGLPVIMCVGETLTEREAGKTNAVVAEQVEIGLGGITAEQMADVVIAYEPVWAIGTGKTPTLAEAEDVHAAIRKLLGDLFGQDVGEATRIQYGGSVKPENIKDFMAQPDIDGALVGGASLKPDSYAKLVNFKK